MKSLDEVAKKTRIKWLRQLGQEALLQYGLRDANLRFISESSFAVFRVDTADQRFALRISPEPPSGKWLTWGNAELIWLEALRREAGLPVPVPASAPDGTTVLRVATDKIPDGRQVTLLQWVPGKRIGKRPPPDLARQIGAFMGQMHQHTEHFSLPTDMDRPHTQWDKLTYWQDPQNDTSALLSQDERDLCSVASVRLLAEIEQIGTKEDYGLVHADLTLNNCLLENGQLQVIDFGDSRYASHFYDIAVPLTDFTEYWSISDQKYQALCTEFYEGYSSVRPLGERYETAVETFMIARAFDVVEWIHLDWPSVTHFSFGPELLSLSLQRIREYMK